MQISSKKGSDGHLITVKEFSLLTKISTTTLYKLIESNKIPYYRIYGSIRLNLADFREGETHEPSPNLRSFNKGH